VLPFFLLIHCFFSLSSFLIPNNFLTNFICVLITDCELNCLTENRDQWRPQGNTRMNFGVA
jgi:hypothetical protein